MAETLGERQASILRAIVREYIRSGEAVGSKHLVDRSRLNVSSATVRNEMARLEELGYLAQPHTSAGRVPTDRGLRFVVDEIKSPRSLNAPQQRALAAEMADGDISSVEDLLRRATDTVSRFTHHAAAILATRGRAGRVRRIELFAVSRRTASMVLIADNGRVEQRMIPLEDIDAAEVEAMAQRLGRELQGVEIERARQTVVAEAEAAAASAPKQRALLESIAGGLDALRAADEHVVVGGVANLAGEGAFERDTLGKLYQALEHQTALLELLAQGVDHSVTVRIGSENNTEPFQSCSIVVASFGGDDEQRGSVSVIGPTRMDYDRVIATANAVARIIEGTLGTPELSG
jgi:heat-inducible transcriptional repressor